MSAAVTSARLSGKVALVFGAASGIGAAVVQRFLGEGATVVASDLIADADRGVLQCDVTMEEDVRAIVSAAQSTHGRIDILVNAAGLIRNDQVGQIEDASWMLMHDVNLRGTLHTMRAVIPWMSQQRSGSIVNIASVAAFNAGPDVASYAASKAGVVALTRSAAQSYGALGIRVNALCPGWVDTPMSAKEMQDLANALGITIQQARERTVERIALGRMASPPEMASVCLFLASDDAAFVTGTALVADGGTRIPAAMRAI